jgi:hypothetical protein
VLFRSDAGIAIASQLAIGFEVTVPFIPNARTR